MARTPSLFSPLVQPPPRAGEYACVMADPPWLERGGGRSSAGPIGTTR
jgi:hypothetical protein